MVKANARVHRVIHTVLFLFPLFLLPPPRSPSDGALGVGVAVQLGQHVGVVGAGGRQAVLLGQQRGGLVRPVLRGLGGLGEGGRGRVPQPPALRFRGLRGAVQPRRHQPVLVLHPCDLSRAGEREGERELRAVSTPDMPRLCST